MTEQNLDEMLKNMYQEGQPLPPEWNERLRKKMAEKKKNPWYQRGVAAAILLFCLLGVPCSVYAYFHYMTPAQTAEEMEQYKLAERFSKQQDEVQTIISKGYRINYLGMVTGKDLEEGLDGAEVEKEKTYIVTAIQRENGETMTESDQFYVSPLIGGLEPIHYNLSTMGGGSAISMIQDGIQYRITECDSVGIFADRTLYLSVQEGNAPDGEAYTMDEQTGEITANPEYTKVNVLFQIQLDKSMADEEKASACIAEIEKELEEPEPTESIEANDVQKEDEESEWSGDCVMKFQGVTVKLLAEDGHRTLDLLKYGESEAGGNEAQQNIEFFPVVQGEGVKKVSFDIYGGLFYGLDSLSEKDRESLMDPYNALYDRYIDFPKVYRNGKKNYYGMQGKGMDSICISMEDGKAEGQYMIRVCHEVQDYSSETISRDQEKVVKKIENIKVKMKIEKEDGSVIEKTIICKTKKYEAKEWDRYIYAYMYSVQ